MQIVFTINISNTLLISRLGKTKTGLKKKYEQLLLSLYDFGKCIILLF